MTRTRTNVLMFFFFLRSLRLFPRWLVRPGAGPRLAEYATGPPVDCGPTRDAMPLAPRINRPQELQTLAPTGFRLTQYGHRAIIPVGISNHLKFSVRPYGTQAHSDSSKDATARTPVAIPVLCNLVHSCFIRGDNPEGSQTESALLCPHKINAGKQSKIGG